MLPRLSLALRRLLLAVISFNCILLSRHLCSTANRLSQFYLSRLTDKPAVLGNDISAVVRVIHVDFLGRAQCIWVMSLIAIVCLCVCSCMCVCIHACMYVCACVFMPCWRTALTGSKWISILPQHCRSYSLLSEDVTGDIVPGDIDFLFRGQTFNSTIFWKFTCDYISDTNSWSLMNQRL